MDARISIWMLIAISIMAGSATADTKYFVGGSMTYPDVPWGWEADANWDSYGVPGSGDDAVVEDIVSLLEPVPEAEWQFFAASVTVDTAVVGVYSGTLDVLGDFIVADKTSQNPSTVYVGAHINSFNRDSALYVVDKFYLGTHNTLMVVGGGYIGYPENDLQMARFHVGTLEVASYAAALLSVSEFADVQIGTLIVHPDAIIVADFAVGATHLAGYGPMQTGPLEKSSGSLSPGLEPSSIGLLTIIGDLSLGGTTETIIEFAGLTSHDQISVIQDEEENGGEIGLGGILRLVLIDEYDPDIDDEFVIISAETALTGTFVLGNVYGRQIVEDPEGSSSGGKHFKLIYDYDDDTFSVKVAAGVLADFSDDGVLNTEDINPFILALTNPTAYASAFPGVNLAVIDPNGDGYINTEDIAIFNHLIGDTPGGGSIIPEPASLAVLLAGMALAARRR